MGTASQWLTDTVTQNVSRGATVTRSIVMSGTNTTEVSSPTKTRTSTETAVATNVVTEEDEGYAIKFAVSIEGGLGKIPAGE